MESVNSLWRSSIRLGNNNSKKWPRKGGVAFKTNDLVSAYHGLCDMQLCTLRVNGCADDTLFNAVRSVSTGAVAKYHAVVK